MTAGLGELGSRCVSVGGLALMINGLVGAPEKEGGVTDLNVVAMGSPWEPQLEAQRWPQPGGRGPQPYCCFRFFKFYF